MKKRYKGIALLYVLFITALLTIYMSGSVQQLLQSVFITKKFTGSEKAYWASFAGQEYIKHKIYENISWPSNSHLGTEKYCDYSVKSEDTGTGIKVHGISDDRTSEFYIFFSKEKHSMTTPEGETCTSIVPSSLPDGITCCSYNTLTAGTSASGTERIQTSSDPSRIATISVPGIYIASEGISGAYKSTTEKLIITENSSLYSGGIYSGGDIAINLKGDAATMQLSKSSTAKPDIFCKGTFYVNRERNEDEEEPSAKKTFPVSLEEGTIYYKDKITIDDRANGENYSSNKMSSRTAFKRKYGLNIDRYSSSNSFPEASWEAISRSAEKSIKNEIPKGTYAAIFCEKEKKHLLYYIPADTSDPDEDTAKKATEEIAQNINRSIDLQELDHSATEAEIDQAVKASYEKSQKIIEVKDKDKAENKNELGASITINTIKKQDKQPAKDNPSEDVMTVSYTPAIHMATDTKAADARDEEGRPIKGISFISLINDGESLNGFRESSKPFNFVFNSNIKESESEHREKNGDKEIITLTKEFTKDPASLYCDGPVRINGMIKGEGQLFAGSSVYFESGSDLNVISESEKKIYGSSNQIAIYAKGSVRMGFLESTTNTKLVNSKIKDAMAGKSSGSQHRLKQDILDTTVNFSQSELAEISGSNIKGSIRLRDFLKNYCGYSNDESQNLIGKTIENNMYVTSHTGTGYAQGHYGWYSYNYTYYMYHMPKDASKISVTPQAPSSFCGIIYTCGGFYANMQGNPMTINGAIVSYGGLPGESLPGSGTGLSEDSLMGLSPGSIKIDNCTSFNIIYDSDTMDAFLQNAETESMSNLVTVYFNKL